MNGGEPSVWSVVSVAAPDLARTERGPAAVQHAEWVRLFLGRAFAPSRLVGPEHAPSAVEYLVSGIDVSGNSRRDDAACIEAAHAVATDFEGLRDVIAYHRERIELCNHAPADAPLELFLTTYPMLMSVTVSDDPTDWRVTDQGLCIVRWGLRGPRHRPLLQWSAQELQVLQRRVIAAAGLVDMAPGELSYRLVARTAWQVLRDDEKLQQMQKVGDGANRTWGESKVANEAPVLANENPDVPRAGWMSWISWKDVGVLAFGIAFGAGVAVAGKAGWDNSRVRGNPTPTPVAQSADGELRAQGASNAGSKSSDVARKQIASGDSAAKQSGDSGKQSNGEQQTGKPGLVTPEGGFGGTGAATGSGGSAPASSTGATPAKAPAAAAESKGGSESQAPAAGSATYEGSSASSMQQGESKGGGATAKEASGQQPSDNAEARKQDGASGGGGAAPGSAGSAPASSTGTTSAKAPAAAAESKGGSESQAPAAGSSKNEGSPTSSTQQGESKEGGAANGTGGSKTSEAAGATTTTPSTAESKTGPAAPVPGTGAEKPASPQSGAAAGDEPRRSEKAPTLESALRQLADLYAKPPSSSPQDNAVNALADVLKDLGQEDGETLRTRLQDRYLTDVRALSDGTRSSTSLGTIHKTTANVPRGVSKVLADQNEAFTSMNFLIRLGDNPADVQEGQISKQLWYWVKLSEAGAFDILKRECTEKTRARSRSKDGTYQTLPIKVRGLVVYRGTRGSTNEQFYAWSSTGVTGFEPPKHVDPPFGRTSESQIKLWEFIESLVKFAGRVSVDDGEVKDVGKANSTRVLMPADVAYDCAKDVLSALLKLEALSKPEANSVDEDFKAWCGRLLKALEGPGNEQANTSVRMREFRESLKHPPFFESGAKPSFVGALSVSDGTPKIINPVTGGSGRPGHLAVLDGLALRHIGYQEEGKPPVFDAPEQLERLVGCAVFVVEPVKPKKPGGK
jgi:hypothetical protein